MSGDATRVQEAGTVVRLEGGRAGIRIQHDRGPACHGCTACRPLGGDDFLLWVNAGDLRPGDEVTVEIPLPSAWRGIGMVLALPLAALMAGVIGGSAWTGLQRWTGLGPDTAGFALGGCLALAALLAARLWDRRFARRYQPRVIDTRRP